MVFGRNRLYIINFLDVRTIHSFTHLWSELVMVEHYPTGLRYSPALDWSGAPAVVIDALSSSGRWLTTLPAGTCTPSSTTTLHQTKPPIYESPPSYYLFTSISMHVYPALW